jgi:hypothetical protein
LSSGSGEGRSIERSSATTLRDVEAEGSGSPIKGGGLPGRWLTIENRFGALVAPTDTAIGDELDPAWLQLDDGLTRSPPRDQLAVARKRSRSKAWPRASMK